MKFKSGDVVVCVRSPLAPQFLGHVLTLTTPCKVHPDSWDTEPPKYLPEFRQPLSFHEPTLRLIKGSDLATEKEKELES